MMVGAVTPLGTASYGYDGFRNRVKKLENMQDTRFINDMTLPYNNLLDMNGQSVVWGNSLISTKGNDELYYLQDHLNSPVRLFGKNQEAALGYDEFGMPLVKAGINQPFGFIGYQTDENGLQYAQARYYSSSLGRFFSEDTHWHPGNMIFGDGHLSDIHVNMPNNHAIIQSSNLNNYCGGNPINRIDISGLDYFIFHCSDFPNQAEWYANQRREHGDTVNVTQVTCIQYFVDAWNRIASYDEITGLSIFVHGNERSIFFDRGYNAISVNGLNRAGYPIRSISELDTLNFNGSVNLFSCNTGHLDVYFRGLYNGHNFASLLSTIVNGGSVRAFDGGMSFGDPFIANLTGNFEPRISSWWSQDSFFSLRNQFSHATNPQRNPRGWVQFVNGELNNAFIPGNLSLTAQCD